MLLRIIECMFYTKNKINHVRWLDVWDTEVIISKRDEERYTWGSGSTTNKSIIKDVRR